MSIATTTAPATTGAPPTVSELLLPGGTPPPELSRTAGAAAKSGGVAEALARLTPVGLDILGARIGRLVGEMLNVDLGDVVGSALTQNRAIADALRSTAEKPDTEAVVPLADHTLKSTYNPAVDIVVDGATVTSIPFDVELATQVEGALLVIKGGRIASVRAGRAVLTASLSCEGVPITERRLDLDIPAVLRLPAADAQVGAVAAPVEATSAGPVGLIQDGWRWTVAGTWEPAGDYRPGDIVNGHRLNATASAWEPLPQ